MAQLYSNHPRRSFNLTQFNQRAETLRVTHPDNDPFIRFALTGEYANDGGMLRQAFIDPIQNTVQPNHPLKISRDYDSLLGIAEKVMVKAPITVYAVPHNSYALKTGIHIKHPVTHGGTQTYVDLHKIPNFEFGKFGDRHHLNFFFPKLWSPERSKKSKPYLTTERERAFFYENGVRPAVAVLLGDSVVSEWPATYATELIRAKKSRGGLSLTTKLIPQHVVHELADRIRIELRDNVFVHQRDIDWAADFFVLHTIRGTKHATFHRVDPHAAQDVLREFLEQAQLSDEVPEVGDWYVDVGIDISSGERLCLQWITLAHRLIVQQALGISEKHAKRITTMGSSKYSRDIASHLTAISGFRVTPGTRAQGPFEAVYIQAYTTDKTVLYNLDAGHHSKFISMKEAMGPEHTAPTILGIYTIYEEAAVANSSNARLEVRVPFRFADKVLMHLDPEVLASCLCSFTSNEWWSFRMFRLLAMGQILALQAAGNDSLRLMDEALTLTAACVWLINGQHARPEDGPAARRLMDAVLPVADAEDLNLEVLAYQAALPAEREEGEEEEEEEEEGGNARRGRLPYNDNGCVFLRRLRVGNVPRLRAGGPILINAAFQYWFKMSKEEVEGKYRRSGFVPRAAVVGRHITNKAKVPRYVDWTGEDPNIFELGARGHSLPPSPREEGSDIEDRATPPPDDAPPKTIDSVLSSIWRQFVIDLCFKSPNPRGPLNPSYLKLTPVERKTGKEDIFKTLTLSDVFNAVAYKKASRKDWDTAFKWLFPMPDYKTTSNVQNYPSCPYFGLWLNFLEKGRDNPVLVTDTRAELWNRLRTWSWIPTAQQDKIWDTSVGAGYTRWPPQVTAKGAPMPAPRILLKERAEPVFE